MKSDKDVTASKARAFLSMLESTERDEIENGISNAVRVRNGDVPYKFNKRFQDTKTKLYSASTENLLYDQLVRNSDKKIGVLVFASYTNPGGGFIKGSIAQEESICHVSALYPVLEAFSDVYEEHKEHTNRSLYHNDGIYIPGLLYLLRGKKLHADTLVLAAPNWGAAKRVKDEQKLSALRARMEFALRVFRQYECDIILLGAWGAGVFEIPVEIVAATWKDKVAKFDGQFENVLHPLPNREVFKKFKEVQ